LIKSISAIKQFVLLTLKKYLISAILIFLFVHAAQSVWSANVMIFGNAPEYARKSIDLNSYHDFISEEIIKQGTINFDAQGTFKLEVEINETTLCFADFDGYHAMIYLEPGKSYEIAFPPKQELSESKRRNPFFKPEQIWFGIINPEKDELNFRIQQFEKAYAIYENQHFDQIFVNRNKSLVDTIKLKLENEFQKTTSAFFEAHKTFREANLDFALNQGKSASFMERYFSTTKPIYNLAAYATIFNQLYFNYFDVFANSPNSAEIRNLINSSNIRQIDIYFQKQLHFNQELSHLVLLKSLNDAYYSKQFSKSGVLKMLDQVKSEGWSLYEQKIAQLIRKNLTWLTSGTNPPAISLKELKGSGVKFSDYAGSYIYIHFTDPKNSICRQHLDALKTVANHYKEKLIIINVVPKGSVINSENGWAGLFTTTESNLEATFRVKTFPSSFLIGKDGKLLLSPAPNPIDGLDRQLGQIYKSDYYKSLQKSGNEKIK
jgi:hypothetical protein